MNETEFIEANKHRPVAELALLINKKPALNATFILAQINGIQKAKIKLPSFHTTPNIIYPSKLSMEQCSSELTGRYKSQLIKGKSLIDLTGGFGVDCYYFAQHFEQVTYVELNKELTEIARQNFKVLNAKNIEVIHASAAEFLAKKKQKSDVIYLDPSRRNEHQRVFQLDQCTPNISNLIPALFDIANQILIKTAPLLDIKKTLKNLPNISKVWVISVENDCKEVLYLMEEDNTDEPSIHAINLTKTIQEFCFSFQEERNATSYYSDPLTFLYEPNSSILKAGAFNTISERYKLKKLAPNTHLYTSEKFINGFPGRSFKIENVLPYQVKEFKKLRLSKANVSCRNFKEKPEQVKKKLKLKDGGDEYIFATTNHHQKTILIRCFKC